MEEKHEEVSSYKMKLELENQRFAEEQESLNLQFQAEKEMLEKQVTTERNDRLAMKKDLEERLESQETQHMTAAEELISLYVRCHLVRWCTMAVASRSRAVCGQLRKEAKPGSRQA